MKTEWVTILVINTPLNSHAHKIIKDFGFEWSSRNNVYEREQDMTLSALVKLNEMVKLVDPRGRFTYLPRKERPPVYATPHNGQSL